MGDTPLTGRMLVLLAGLAALGALATNIILPSFAQMGAELGVDERRLALILSGFFVTFALGQLIVGPLSDRIGRRPVVLGGLATFAAGSLICAMAPDFPTLMAGRVVQALGACATSVLARAVARDLFDGAALVRTLALVMVAMAAAPGFSPLVGAGLGAWLGWRGTFAVVGFAGVALALHYLLSAGETLPPARRRRQGAGRIAAEYLRLMRDARFIGPALAVSLVIGGLYTFFATAPLVLITRLGLSSLGLGLFLAATVFVVFGAGFAAPRLAARFGRARVAFWGIGLALLGALGLFGFVAAPSLASFTASLVVFLFGMGLINPLGTAIALEPFKAEAGQAAALLGFLQMGCAAIGATLAGLLPVGPEAALALVTSCGCALAGVVFLPVAARQTAVQSA